MQRIKLLVFVFMLLLLFATGSVVAQNYTFTGKVIDSKTKKALAFVSLTIQNQNRGTLTDIDGKFILNATTSKEFIRFSFVGYEPQTILIHSKEVSIIELKEKQVSIQEVIVFAGENPAHRIIKNAIRNRVINNPENLTSFRYNSYNKFIFTGIIDSSKKFDNQISSADSLKSPSKYFERDSINRVLEKQQKRTDSILATQHVFMMESVTQRDFLFPDLNSETIKASKVSGLKNPQFLLVASQFQSFSFYRDYIDVLDKKYLSPISPNSFNNYFFTIEDTLFETNDSIFVLSFKPKKNKNFDALMGLIYINTAGFAIQNVIAEPVESFYFGIKIQQKYEKIDGKYWFPTQLNTDIDFKGMLSVNGEKMVGIGRTYLKNIEIGLKLEKKGFTEIEVEYDKNAIKNSEEMLMKFRVDSLIDKEKRTYVVMDSIGKKEKFDEKLKVFSIISDGYIPWGYVQFDWRKILVGYNDYEGLRVGLGLATSKKFSNWISLNSYIAIGTKDGNFKYGGGLNIPIDVENQFEISLQYKNDISESGLVTIRTDKIQQAENYRMLVVNRFDKIESLEGQVTFRSLQYLKSTIFVKQTSSNVIGSYTYGSQLQTSFLFHEAGIAWRYAYREKFMRQANKLISLGTKHPIVFFQYTIGKDYENKTNSLYHKLDFKISKSITLRGLGLSSINFNMGKIIGETPYSISYNTQANRSDRLTIVSKNNFETMYSNEFLSTEFLSLFLTHDFGKLLLKTEKFQPGFALVTNMTIGNLSNTYQHQGIAFKVLDKGYIESGLIISDLLRMKTNLYTSGFGLGVYYRYGNYAFAKAIDNFTLKLDFKISF